MRGRAQGDGVMTGIADLTRARHPRRAALACALATVLAACGGGGSGSGLVQPPSPPPLAPPPVTPVSYTHLTLPTKRIV